MDTNPSPDVPAADDPPTVADGSVPALEAETPPGFSEALPAEEQSAEDIGLTAPFPAVPDPLAEVVKGKSITIPIIPPAVAVEVKSLSLPLYQCHKQVRAAKIAKVDTSFVRPEISFEDASLVPVAVTPAWFVKHQPQVGGYYVVYADGYASYSPAQAFEDGYSAI